MQASLAGPSGPWSSYAQLTLVSVIWGGSFVAGRHLAGELAPLLAASLRFIVASAMLLGYLLLTRQRLVMPDARQWGQLALLGLCGIFLYNLCFFLGLQQTTASRAALIVALNPAAIALLSWLFFRERLTRLQGIGIALCVFGAAWVIVHRDVPGSPAPQNRAGDALILGCVLCWALYSVLSRSVSTVIGALLTVCYSIWIGTAMLVATAGWFLPAAAWTGVANLSLAQWLSLLYLGGLSSALAYIWYYDGIRQIGASRAGAFIALNPVSAVLLGSLLFGEVITPAIAVGAILVVAGIMLNNRFSGR
ncbi:DMT family transporter [Jeongeupia naejangsanensis]|uniref:DMT family transporter n=2 Tax=Jeongeupia naejangsanensis TaxID=613195 RepID=A0ABS2BNJ5_9NEIS|nr:DMT family transporter [Jeongeupia naejangsanensis]